MRNREIMVTKMQEGKSAQKHGLSPEAVSDVVEEHIEEMLQSMILNGYIMLNENLRIEIVPIQPRKYVLKGSEYRSTRVYKLKATMGDPIYDRIAAKFDAFRDDLEEVGN